MKKGMGLSRHGVTPIGDLKRLLQTTNEVSDHLLLLFHMAEILGGQRLASSFEMTTECGNSFVVGVRLFGVKEIPFLQCSAAEMPS